MQLIPNALWVLLPKARRPNQFFRLPTDGIALDVAQIAEVAHQAATDGEDELLYVAGPDARTTYAMCLQDAQAAKACRNSALRTEELH